MAESVFRVVGGKMWETCAPAGGPGRKLWPGILAGLFQGRFQVRARGTGLGGPFQ